MLRKHEGCKTLPLHEVGVCIFGNVHFRGFLAVPFAPSDRLTYSGLGTVGRRDRIATPQQPGCQPYLGLLELPWPGD